MNAHACQRPSRRGFMMIELLVSIVLLSVFALVATRLFTWATRVTAEAPAAEGQILLFDSMLGQLRADAWSSPRIRTSGDRNIDLDDGAIRWAVQEDGCVTRTAGADTRAWRDVGQRVRFEPVDAGVIVRVLDRHGSVSDRILLSSEVGLLRRAMR